MMLVTTRGSFTDSPHSHCSLFGSLAQIPGQIDFTIHIFEIHKARIFEEQRMIRIVVGSAGKGAAKKGAAKT